ncbi:MAG: PIG-L deacetylase family protein [Phycisphaerae bacterium]
MSKKAFAIACHPDDIEFGMAGTLILLKNAGYEIHYMNVANGSCGTAVYDKDDIIALRTAEARTAARSVGAIFHFPLVDDLEVYYDRILVSKLCAVVRKVDPEIVLLQSPQDYMEDHTNTVRVGVTAAFCRNMKNFVTDPPIPPVATDMAVYHALPHGLMDQLRNPIIPDFYVDITSVLKTKRQMLACHKTQKEWLDHSQGMDSYLTTMEDMSAQVGEMSKKFQYAEGWRRHSHLGFGTEEFDPLGAALGKYITKV